MTKTDMEKVVSILLNNEDRYDMLGALKREFPKFSDLIAQRIREDDSAEEFEEEVMKKAKELFVQEGNDPVHFMTSMSKGHYRYIEKARKILKK